VVRKMRRSGKWELEMRILRRMRDIVGSTRSDRWRRRELIFVR
jgi:hypothetical protein